MQNSSLQEMIETLEAHGKTTIEVRLPIKSRMDGIHHLELDRCRELYNDVNRYGAFVSGHKRNKDLHLSPDVRKSAWKAAQPSIEAAVKAAYRSLDAEARSPTYPESRQDDQPIFYTHAHATHPND